MSVLSEGFAGWFRPKHSALHDEEQNRASTTTGGEIDQEPVVVWMAANQMEADIVKARLESEGIPALIRGEALGSIYGLTTGTLAQRAVLVPAALAEKAEALLQSDESWEDADETGGADDGR
jgi:Putative prokaryotic signal transducing protein